MILCFATASGWSYAYRFRSLRGWSGRPTAFSFVRRRRWIRKRVYQPQQLLSQSESKQISQIAQQFQDEWDSLRNSELTDRLTPDDGSRIEQRLDHDHVGIKAATSLLPLSPAYKQDIFSWSSGIEIDDPFVAWSFVKENGERILARRTERDAKGSRSEEALFGIWRDAIVVINLRRVSRVMKELRLDREKLEVFRWWLGLELDPLLRMNSIAKDFKDRPDLDDVWSLVEMRVGCIHLLFLSDYAD